MPSGELRRGGLKVKLSGQPFEVLVTLLEKSGQVVTREELHQKLWAQDTFVDFEHGLNKAINKVRDALGDDADNPRFIETLPRRGYRFLPPLMTSAPAEAPAVGQVTARQPPTASALLGAGTPRWSTNRRKLWAVGLAGLCAFLAVGFYWFTHASSMRPPRVLRYRQLTADRQIKGAGPLWLDELNSHGRSTGLLRRTGLRLGASFLRWRRRRQSPHPLCVLPLLRYFPRQNRIVGASSH